MSHRYRPSFVASNKAKQFAIGIVLLILIIKVHSAKIISSSPTINYRRNFASLSSRGTLLTVMIITQPNTSRLETIYNAYISELLKNKKLNVFFVNGPKQTYAPNVELDAILLSQIRNRKVVWRILKKDRPKSEDLLVAFYSGAKEFLKTDSKWLYRGIDDTFINSKALQKYMEMLERDYPDPLKTKYIFGNCVIDARNEFLQGGSGMIFSRAAVEDLWKFKDEAIQSMNNAEDVWFSQFIESKGYSFAQMSSPYFTGHSFKKSIYTPYSNASTCEHAKVKYSNKCINYVIDPHQIVFFHIQTPKLEDALNAFTQVINAPPGYYVHNLVGSREFCVNRNQETIDSHLPW